MRCRAHRVPSVSKADACIVGTSLWHMNPERWQQISVLYHTALERAPRERVALLADAEGDGRKAVALLLVRRSTATGVVSGFSRTIERRARKARRAFGSVVASSSSLA